MKNISLQEMQLLVKNIEHKEDTSTCILDVRQKEELQYGMLPFAKNIELSELEEAFELTENEFEKKYNFKKPKASDRIICYCRTGVRAKAATQALLKLTYNAQSFKGSIWEWSTVDTKVKRYGPGA